MDTQKYSFIKLLEDYKVKDGIIDKIEIPIIQRDYAQGRNVWDEDKKSYALNNTGDRFIKSVFHALDSQDEKIMDMDFVYGSTLSDSKKVNIFTPLDGQQRLTTLFLLYWYVAKREIHFDQVANQLKKFTYCTRISSRRFCEMLCKKNIDISKSTNVSAFISNQSWFFMSYKQDPTIKGMLNMLDRIEELYNEKNGGGQKDYYNRLSLLQFSVLPLERFNLTDDLYIKMNARGKQLTDFENFKSDFIGWLKTIFPEKKVAYKNRENLLYYMKYSIKMDIDWTNLFWETSKKFYPEENNKQNDKDPLGKAVDPLFIRFFNRYFCNLVCQQYEGNDIASDDLFKYFYGREGDDNTIKYSDFDNYAEILSKQKAEDIERILDTICNNKVIIEQELHPAWEKDSTWTFYDRYITQRQRVALFALTQFIIQWDKFNAEAYKEWMRFVWNIIVDPSLRSIPMMLTAMKFINHAVQYSDSILQNIVEGKIKSDRFETQLKDEKLKAQLLMKEGWKERILYAESHHLFKGNIGFLFNEGVDTPLPYFNIHLEKAENVFPVHFDDNNYGWLKATLAQITERDSVIMDAVNSCDGLVLGNGKFDNWRSLINGPLMPYFRLLLDLIGTDSAQYEQRFVEICTNYQRIEILLWLYPLIDSRIDLLKYSETKKVKTYQWNYIYLFNKTKWTNGNIILSTYRNEIVSKLILVNCCKTIGDEWLNIENLYFRSLEIYLIRDYTSKVRLFYKVTQTDIYVRIPSTSARVLLGEALLTSHIEDEWYTIYTKNYSEVNDSSIDKLLKDLEDELECCCNHLGMLQGVN